jgi:ankyrin repeat protein
LGVNYDIKDIEGNRAADIAKDKGYQELMNLLITHKLSV